MNLLKKTAKTAFCGRLGSSGGFCPQVFRRRRLTTPSTPKTDTAEPPDSITIPALDDAKRSTVYYGDVDYSSSVDVTDALLVLQSSVGKVEFNQYETDRANVDGSADEEGNATLTVSDALLVLQRSVSKIKAFPAEEAVVKDALNLKVKLKCHEDGSFKVLQVSDFQDNCSSGQVIKDGTMQRFNAMVDAPTPTRCHHRRQHLALPP